MLSWMARGRRVPFFAQMEATECGAACLAMVLAHHGHWTSLQELRLDCAVTRDVTSADRLVRAARARGLEGEGFNTELEGLGELPMPAILHWEFRHFVVLERVTRKGAVLLDPAWGRLSVDWDRLRKSYTGIALAFEPSPGFRTRAQVRASLSPYRPLLASYLPSLLGEQLITTVLDGVLLLGYFALMWAYHSGLALVIVGMAGLQLGVQACFRKVNQQRLSEELAATGRSSASVLEALESLETIKAMGSESASLRRWCDQTLHRMNTGLRRQAFQRLTQACTSLAVAGGTAAVFAGAGHEVMGGRMSIGTFSAFLTLETAFMTLSSALVDAMGRFQLLGSHQARLEDVLEEPVEPSGTRDPGPLVGRVSLRKVAFQYLEEGPPILADLSVGMLNPTRGSIQFDGHDLRDLDRAALRNRVGVVLQERFLLHDSIRANLALYDPELPLARLREAARVACIDDFIETLAEGYDTILDENGGNLSGGQKQRLALARALAHRPAVLLLDEATSSLDLATESRVHRNLAQLGCTRILIAHRLETVKDADRILVLEKGQVVQTGSYGQLLEAPGLFRSFVESSEAIRG